MAPYSGIRGCEPYLIHLPVNWSCKVALYSSSPTWSLLTFWLRLRPLSAKSYFSKSNTKLITTNLLNPPLSPKLIPWFVSDVTPPDFAATFESLKHAPSFFEIKEASAIPSVDHLNKMVTRWKKYLDEGLFSLYVPLDTSLGDASTAQGQDAAFWTSMYPYWDMETHAPRLYTNLKSSDLVVFKVSLYLCLCSSPDIESRVLSQGDLK